MAIYTSRVTVGADWVQISATESQVSIQIVNGQDIITFLADTLGELPTNQSDANRISDYVSYSGPPSPVWARSVGEVSEVIVNKW